MRIRISARETTFLSRLPFCVRTFQDSRAGNIREFCIRVMMLLRPSRRLRNSDAFCDQVAHAADMLACCIRFKHRSNMFFVVKDFLQLNFHESQALPAQINRRRFIIRFEIPLRKIKPLQVVTEETRERCSILTITPRMALRSK